MKDKIVFITKDAFRADYLPIYGNKYWKTPNIDELAKKGTVFLRHYTSAPSSAMAYTSMFSGLHPHQLNRSKYTEVKHFDQASTVFDILSDKGYKCHIIWNATWMKIAHRYSKSYGDHRTTIHNIEIQNAVGPHKSQIITFGNAETEKATSTIISTIKKIINMEKLFLWIHLPHVYRGRPGYGSDIDLYDSLIGKLRDYFDDNSIYISADHGHMNCDKGIPVYGFHVYEGAIRVPFITPRINGCKEIKFPTSHTQLKEIILENKISKHKFVYSDSQYYLQENRKLAIIKGNYKYIFNKVDHSEELYDLEFDLAENVNLLIDRWFDRNRSKYYKLNEVYFYPKWQSIKDIYEEFKNEKIRIWKEGSKYYSIAYGLKRFMKKGLKNINILFRSDNTIKGLFNSKARSNSYNK